MPPESDQFAVPAFVVGVLAQRLESAWTAGHLELSCLQVAQVLLVLFPDDYADRPPPDPTEALPGTPAKQADLADRAAAGLALFHPRDADWTSRDRLARQIYRDREGNDHPQGVVECRADGPRAVPEQDYNPGMKDGKFRWRFTLPDGRFAEVVANTRSEARTRGRLALGVRKRQKNIRATVEFLGPSPPPEVESDAPAG